MGVAASCSNRQPSRSLIERASRAALLLLLWLLTGGPVLRADLRTRRRQLVERERLRHPTHRLDHHRAALILPHRSEILDRDEPADVLVTFDLRLGGGPELAERLAGHLHFERRLAASLVCPSQHRDIGIVTPAPELDVLPVQRSPSVASSPTQPYGGV